MTPDRLKEIRGIDLFKNISDPSFASLTQAAYVQNFPPNVELITEGEPSDFMYIVISGSVELFANWGKNETTLATVWPVSSFILAATINKGPYLMSARTGEKSRIVMVPSEDVRQTFENDPEFAKSIVSELAKYYRAGLRNTKNLKLRTSKERLANYLIKTGKKNQGATQFLLKYEKRRLASYLGMTPENLSRAFASLKEFGVRVDGQKVSLDNLPALIEFAKPTALIDG